MRRSMLFLLGAGMLACSGESDNPGAPASGGNGGDAGSAASGGGSSGRGGSGGRGGSAGSGEGGADAAGEGGADAAGESGASDGGVPAVDRSYCGSLTESLTTGSGVPVTPATELSETPVADSECGAVERTFASEGQAHGEACVDLAYGTNPPSSGTHYGTWAAYREYGTAIPRGFWVHALEHGAVVIAYSCTDCDAEIERARELIAELGPDPLCCSEPTCTGASTRLIMTPDPRLESRWAAAAWGATLVLDCFEEAPFRSFVELHRGRGPEGVCADGVDVENYQN